MHRFLALLEGRGNWLFLIEKMYAKRSDVAGILITSSGIGVAIFEVQIPTRVMFNERCRIKNGFSATGGLFIGRCP